MQSKGRPIPAAIALFAALLWTLPHVAYAEREGAPYRGPSELLAGGSGDSTDSGSGDTGTTTDPGSGDPGADPGSGQGAPPTTTPSGGGVGVGQGGKKATIDGSILWSWWWEHNKDRHLARATERGRVNAGSIYYWFGAGAKFPPREIVPVSEGHRATAYTTLKRALNPKEETSTVVRAEACIAMGRLGNVPAGEKEIKAGEPNNLVVRALIEAFHGENGQTPDSREIRHSALLGLGICGDADAGAFLHRNFDKWNTDEKADAAIAFGLLRYEPAIDLLVRNLPTSASGKETADQIAAIHALGLYGPAWVEAMNAEDRKGIAALKKLAGYLRGSEPVVTQAVAALGRLQQERRAVENAIERSKSNNIQWTGILALGNYTLDEKDAESAAKALEGYSGKGAGQQKNFAVLTLGELASRLDPNSKVRMRILKFLQSKDALGHNDNYVKACAAIALGVADDRTASHAVAELLKDTKVDDFVIGAACVSLGLLHATEHADLLITQVLLDKKWKADARGYGLLGLALMGDTTRMEQILKYTTGSVPKETERQLTLAMGVLGDEGSVKALVHYFSSPWKSNRRHMVSNAAYGLGYLKDQSAVDQAAKVASTGTDVSVRALAVIALGYVGSQEPVSALSRCYAGQNYLNRFSGWGLLYQISRIL